MTPSHMAFSALTSPPCLRSTLRQPAAISTVAVALLAVGTAGAGCGGARSAPATGPPIARQAVIAELQAFGQGLGIARTGNFQRFSDARAAVYRCYFAGQLELPASYETLQLVEPDEPTCPVDETMYDLFFYPIEAVASGSSPVSPALASAALERTLVVVPHEDFHNQPETAQASFDVAEAAATLVGFVAARDFAAPFDSVWLDLSKGLGCPFGGVLAGSDEFVDQAWTWKHRFGGAMREAGIFAAAGLHALDHHVDRLAEDHANARLFADRIAEVPGIVLDPSEVETNLVFFNVDETGLSAKDISDQLLEKGIRIGIEGAFRMRLVTHLDVDRKDIEEATDVLTNIITHP